MEKWKNVVGYEGLYEVSDIGRVKNSRTNHIYLLEYLRDIIM